MAALKSGLKQIFFKRLFFASVRNRSFYFKAFCWTAFGLILSVALLYPQCRDGVDPDATAYLTLARRWAAGDFKGAVNGYWSPLSIWLTALLMRLKIGAVPAAWVQNTAAALTFLGASLALFRKFGVSKRLLVWAVPALGFFLLHAVFYQWFSDLWGAAFALLAFRVLIGEHFCQKSSQWLLYGLLGTLAYLGKSFYLLFGILLLCGALYRSPVRAVFAQAKATFFSLLTLAVLCLPWWIALQTHYGFWTAGVAGSLNLSWGVAGHQLFADAGGAFLPPLYPDSVSYWEDPWWVNARLVHFWDTPEQALKMIPRVGYFGLRLLQKAALLSLFLPIAVFEIIRSFFQNRFRFPGDFKIRLLQAAVLLFLLPFLLLYTEVRYLWFLAPLLVIWIDKTLLEKHFNPVVAGLLALSLCVSGVVNFPEIWGLGKKEKTLAAQLKTSGISGDFATDHSFTYAEGLRVAYFSGMRYWASKSDTAKSKTQLLDALKAAGVPYLLSGTTMIQTTTGKVVWQAGSPGKP